MYPYLFGFEFLESYYVMIIIGIFVALSAFKIVMKHYQVPFETYNFYLKLALISMVVGFLFAFLFQQAYNLIDALMENREYQAQGMTLMGGIIGGLTTWFIGNRYFAKEGAKQQFFLVTSIATFSIMIGHAFGRIGCFLAGCCYGVETDAWYGMKFVTHDHNVVPTQLFEAIFMFLLIGVGIYMIMKKKINYVSFLYFITYPIFRFFIEFLRGDERGTLLPLFSPSQWQSILMLVIAVVLLVKYVKNPFKTGYQENKLVNN